jgi:hypothetical protein
MVNLPGDLIVRMYCYLALGIGLGVYYPLVPEAMMVLMKVLEGQVLILPQPWPQRP